MKKITLIKKIIITVMLIGADLAPAFAMARVEGRMENMTIVQCNVKKTKCLRATAQKALGSQFSALHSLTQIHVQIFNSNQKLINQYQSETGYLAPESQRLVLMLTSKANSLQELEIDLSSLDIKAKVMK